MMSPTWEVFYKDWTEGGSVYLQLLETTWPIKIERRVDVCYFSVGWIEFVHEVGLREGDYLVAFRDDLVDTKMLKVCIYKKDEHSLVAETCMLPTSMLKSHIFLCKNQCVEI